MLNIVKREVCLTTLKMFYDEMLYTHDKTFFLEQHPTHLTTVKRLYDEMVNTIKRLFLNNIQQIWRRLKGCMMKWSTR